MFQICTAFPLQKCGTFTPASRWRYRNSTWTSNVLFIISTNLRVPSRSSVAIIDAPFLFSAFCYYLQLHTNETYVGCLADHFEVLVSFNLFFIFPSVCLRGSCPDTLSCWASHCAGLCCTGLLDRWRWNWDAHSVGSRSWGWAKGDVRTEAKRVVWSLSY